MQTAPHTHQLQVLRFCRRSANTQRIRRDILSNKQCWRAHENHHERHHEMPLPCPEPYVAHWDDVTVDALCLLCEPLDGPGPAYGDMRCQLQTLPAARYNRFLDLGFTQASI